jgi:hypothetical protein
MSRVRRLHAQEIYRIRKDRAGVVPSAAMAAVALARYGLPAAGAAQAAYLRRRDCGKAASGRRRAARGHGQAVATVQVKLIVAGTTEVLAAVLTVTV